MQETHYYKTTRYHGRGIESTAKRAGWIAHHAQATISDPKAGVAVSEGVMPSAAGAGCAGGCGPRLSNI
jgi:hypothetical protein